MALAYARQGGCNAIVIQFSSGAVGQVATLAGSKVNGGSAYSIVGGSFVVKTADSASGTLNIQIGSASILAAPQATTATGTFDLVLSNTVGSLSGVAGDNLVVTCSQAAVVQVTLYLSGTLEDVV